MQVKEFGADINILKTGSVQAREIANAAIELRRNIEELINIPPKIAKYLSKGRPEKMRSSEEDLLKHVHGEIHALLKIDEEVKLMFHRVMKELEQYKERNKYVMDLINQKMSEMQKNAQVMQSTLKTKAIPTTEEERKQREANAKALGKQMEKVKKEAETANRMRSVLAEANRKIGDLLRMLHEKLAHAATESVYIREEAERKRKVA